MEELTNKYKLLYDNLPSKFTTKDCRKILWKLRNRYKNDPKYTMGIKPLDSPAHLILKKLVDKKAIIRIDTGLYVKSKKDEIDPISKQAILNEIKRLKNLLK